MLISVYVKLKKSQNRVYWQEETLSEEVGRKLIIEISQKPIKGRANEKIIELLAQFFQTKKMHIRIKRGKTSQYKIVEIL